MAAEFDVERFERVEASSGTALLRLSGTFTAEPPADLGTPELVIDNGRDARRVAALPDPSGRAHGGRDWRAAFPVPAALLEGGKIAFALSTSGAGIIDLPDPRPQRGRPEPPPRPAPAPRRREVDMDWLTRQTQEAAYVREQAENATREADQLR